MRYSYLRACFTDLPPGGLENSMKNAVLSGRRMHSSKLLHGCTAALRADADIKIPDRFEQFRHGHTGITLPETLSALKFKNNRQVVCLHAVVQETIVPDFLKPEGRTCIR